MKSIIIGDIHGCSSALRLLLAKISPNAEEDRLILLGDLFDRGPDSWGVFGIVQELAEKYGQTFIDLQAAWDELFTHMHPANIAWDRIHPNHVGCVYIANQILKATGFQGL